MSKKNKHIDLFKDIIPCVDLNQKGLWDAVDEDARKELRADLFTLNRYISNVSAPSQSWQKGKRPTREEQEHFVLAVNEYYNKHFFTLQKHPKLQWMLLCMCNYDSETTFYHEYISHKRPTTKKIDFLASVYPTYKIEDVELLSQLMSDKEVEELARNQGLDDATIKKLLK